MAACLFFQRKLFQTKYILFDLNAITNGLMKSICYCVLFISCQLVTRTLKKRRTEGRRVNSLFKRGVTSLLRQRASRRVLSHYFSAKEQLNRNEIHRCLPVALHERQEEHHCRGHEGCLGVCQYVFSLLSSILAPFTLLLLECRETKKKAEGTLLPPTCFSQSL